MEFCLSVTVFEICSWPILTSDCCHLYSRSQGLGSHSRASLREDGLYRRLPQETARANPVGVCDEGAGDDGANENGPHQSQETKVAGGRACTKGIVCVRVKLLGVLTSLDFMLADNITHFPDIDFRLSVTNNIICYKSFP